MLISKEQIQGAASVVCTTDPRYSLDCVRITESGEIQATDGHMLLVIATGQTADREYLLPVDFLKTVQKSMKKGETAELNGDLAVGSASFAVPVVEDVRFPDVSVIIPDDGKFGNEVCLSPQLLKRICEHYIRSGSDSVRIRLFEEEPESRPVEITGNKGGEESKVILMPMYDFS